MERRWLAGRRRDRVVLATKFGFRIDAEGRIAGLTKRADEFPPGDFRPGQPRIRGENFDANLHLLAGVEDLATRMGGTPAQAALATIDRAPD